jgi:tRNA U38,U39,U40 pseudouridine synthase TruA
MGQRDADDMSEILASRSRENAGPTAPAKGLILWELRYDGRGN